MEPTKPTRKPGTWVSKELAMDLEIYGINKIKEPEVTNIGNKGNKKSNTCVTQEEPGSERHMK